MGGWKQKEESSLLVPSTLLFLYQRCFCLCVSGVRAYHTTNQQHGIPCLIKRGPLPDWPVWTRAQMEGSAAARGEGSSEEKKETAPPEESASALCPTIRSQISSQISSPIGSPIGSPIRSPIRSPISAEERKDYEDRGNSIAIRQDGSSATITTAESTVPEPTVQVQFKSVLAMLKERTESLLRMARTPTTQVEVPPSGEKALNEGKGNEVPAAQPKISLFPYKNKKRAIRPKNFSVAPSSDTTEEMAESQLGDEPGLQLESGAPAEEPKVLTPPNGDDDVDYDDEELGTSVEGADTIAHNADGTLGDDHGKGSDTSDDCLRVFEDELLDGSVEGQSSQPVITQQIIRDLIINQRQTISQPPTRSVKVGKRRSWVTADCWRDMRAQQGTLSGPL